MIAHDILGAASDAIAQRAKLRDLPQGERSIARAVAAFNAIAATNLDERDGWLFMVCLKMARATAGEHHLDDFIDMASYAALAGESSESDSRGSR